MSGLNHEPYMLKKSSNSSPPAKRMKGKYTQNASRINEQAPKRVTVMTLQQLIGEKIPPFKAVVSLLRQTCWHTQSISVFYEISGTSGCHCLRYSWAERIEIIWRHLTRNRTWSMKIQKIWNGKRIKKDAVERLDSTDVKHLIKHWRCGIVPFFMEYGKPNIVIIMLSYLVSLIYERMDQLIDANIICIWKTMSRYWRA